MHGRDHNGGTLCLHARSNSHLRRPDLKCFALFHGMPALLRNAMNEEDHVLLSKNGTHHEGIA